MATRKNTFLVRRSNVAGNVPTAGQLLLGELALNTADVILYTSGTTANSILPIGWDRISRTGDTMTGSFSAPTISATTYYNLPNDLPSGGTTGQILAKIDATNYNTEWIDNYTSQLKHVVSAGEVINKGQAVYVSSANGTNIIVSKASNTSEATSSKTLGLLAQTLSINGQGFVITEGLLAGLNTLGANAGDPVWLGTNGNLIYGLPNKPYAPAHLVFIGIVTRVNANNGEIFVKVQNGFELNEIHDVDLKTTTPIDGHILGYNGTLWVNKTIAGWLGFTPANDANVLHTTGNESASGIKTFSDTTQSTSISSGAVIVGGGMGISKNLYVGGNLNLGGNLNIGGTLTTINAQNLSVSDNMIYLNNGIQTTITNAVGNGTTVIYTTQETHNYLSGMTVSISGINPTAYNLTNQTIISVSTNSFTISNSASGLYVSGGIARAKTSVNPDLGFAGGYNDGSYAHTGLFRDATDGVWKFFKGYTPEPDASPFIDTSDPTFAYADLRAFNITSNSFIKVGGTSGQFLKADGSIDSTLYTPTPRTLTINSTSYDLSANRSWDIPIVTANTFNNGTYDLIISTSNGLNYTSNLGLLATDVKVTGGTYNINTGTVTFTNSTGGTFNVTGFSSGMTDTYTTGGTYSNGTATFTRTNGGTYDVTGFKTTDTYWSSGSSGSYSIKAVNNSGLDAVGAYAVAEGYATLASGSSSHAEGYLSKAGGNYSHAEGYQTIATGIVSHAQGYRTIASGYASHAEGQYNTASGELSHAEGSFNNATGNYSHVGGTFSQANGISSFVHGNNSIANGDSTIVLGSNIVGDNSNTTYVENLIVSGDVQTQFNIVGDGNVITFTNPNYGNTYETIDTGIAITRGVNQGPYNPFYQSSWAGYLTHMKWNGDGWVNLEGLLNRDFIDDIQQAVGGPLGNYIVGKELIMWDTLNNKYYKFKFTWWQQSNGGGFTYERELITTIYGTTSSSKFIVQGGTYNQYSRADGSIKDFIELSPSTNVTALSITGNTNSSAIPSVYIINTGDTQGIKIENENGVAINAYSTNGGGILANSSYGNGVEASSYYGNAGYFVGGVGAIIYGYSTGSATPIIMNTGYGQIFTLKNNGNLLLNQTTDNNIDKIQVNGTTLTTGYKKSGSSDSYLLLGGGGHTLASNYVPSSRTITINGTTLDLSANRSWTITGGVSGSGTSGYIPRFTSATAIGDGRMQDDGAGLVTLTSNSSSNAMFILDASANNSALVSHKMSGSMYYLTGMDSSQNYRFNVYNAGSFVNCAIYIPKATTRVIINGTTDDGSSQFQVNGTAKVTSSLTANSFVKIGGTSTQFLKADGSVDTNTYATTGSLSSYVPTSRTITINGTSYDLSENRSWTVSATETDTLATVTSRGNTSTGDVNINGELAVKNALINNQQNTSFGVGTTTVFSRLLSSYTAFFFDYVVTSGSNARAGSIMAVVNGGNVEFTETSTNDIGNTSALTFSVLLNGTNLELRATSTSGTWSAKILCRVL